MTSLSLFMNTRQNQNNTRKNQNQLCIRKLPGNLVDSDSHRNDKNQRTDNSENAVNHNRLPDIVGQKHDNCCRQLNHRG